MKKEDNRTCKEILKDFYREGIALIDKALKETREKYPELLGKD